VERLVVITGLSGSGKTLAADCFEDLGYFCVDNLPVALIAPFRALIQRSRGQVPRAALVIDVRGGAFLDQFPAILQRLRDQDAPVELLFFECADDVLKRRFSESRRPHPMARTGGTLEQAIRQERSALGPLRDMADRIIDTSDFTAHQLRTFLKNAFDVTAGAKVPRVNVVSFGFKYGVPAEVDLLFDVRFLPNPYFVDSLRPLDGRNARIQDYLDQAPTTGEFLDRLQSFLGFLVPHYATEGKSYLTVALGCTGGRHRSVALAERLGRYFRAMTLPTSVSHRDIGRD
jgi:UPF0042 nucleotide-binding protein